LERVERCHDDYRNLRGRGNDLPIKEAAVFRGVRPVLGVTEAAVDLVTGGRSPLVVMRGTKLGAGSVHDAVRNALFDLTTDGAPVVGGYGDGASTRQGDTTSDHRTKSYKEGEGRDRQGLPNCGTGRGTLASKTSRTDTVPAHFRNTAALVHSESTLEPVIVQAARRAPSRRRQ